MSKPRNKSMRLVTIFTLVFLASIWLASGGPDPHVLPFCETFYEALETKQRNAIHDVVQILQAMDAHLSFMRQGLPPPIPLAKSASPSVATLEEWRHRNATKLLALMEAVSIPEWKGLSVRSLAVAATSCLSAHLKPDRFTGRPLISILLNYFKRPNAVSRIPALLRSSCESVGLACELVVNVDNPHEAKAWAVEAAAGGAGVGFMVVPVFSANLHEVHGYNRVARLARGRYLIIWQDDQLPPSHGQWLLDMMKLFDTYPALGVLGMNTYRLCRHKERNNLFGHTSWQPDPKTGISWTFAQAVDFAPFAIRTSIFFAIGTLDETMARRGDCGIWSDWELCARVMMDGWQIGFMFLEGRSGDNNVGSTHVGANYEKCWKRQHLVARHVTLKRHNPTPMLESVCERVWLQNMQRFTVKSGKCPYGTWATRWGSCIAPPADKIASLLSAGSGDVLKWDRLMASAGALVAAALAVAGVVTIAVLARLLPPLMTHES